MAYINRKFLAKITSLNKKDTWQKVFVLLVCGSKICTEKEVFTKIGSYQNTCTQNVYFTGNVYLKRVPKRRVKVRLNWSKSLKLRINLQSCVLQPWLSFLHFFVIKTSF